MKSEALRKQLEKLENDATQLREEIRRTSGGQARLIPALAATEEQIKVLNKRIEKAELDEQNRVKYLGSPEYKKDQKIILEKSAQMDELNTRYCQEGEQLLEKIQALHQLDSELLELRKKEDPGAGLVMGSRQFTQLDYLEQGLRKAAEVGLFVTVKNMRKNK